LLLLRGAFDDDVVEEERGGDGGLGDRSEGVEDPWCSSGRDDRRAEAAVIELVEDGTADEFPGAIGMDSEEDSRDELAPKCVYRINVALLLLG
jgi:hypothetical protein